MCKMLIQGKDNSELGRTSLFVRSWYRKWESSYLESWRVVVVVVVIIIMIKKAYQQHKFPGLSLAILSNQSLLLASLLDGIQCQHKADECKFLLVSHMGVHRRTLLLSLSLFLEPCPACLVCLTWMAYEMGSKWLYSSYLMECWFQDLFKKACNILA